MRVFVAIPVPFDLKKQMADVPKRLLYHLNTPVRWVNKEDYHVTVKFCGDVDMQSLPELIELLEKTTSKHKAFEIAYSHFTVWPETKPRIILLHIAHNKVLEKLVKEVSKEIDKSELIFKQFYGMKSPHLTLGRVKGKWEDDAFSLQVGFEQQVDELQLISSELTPEGPIYTVLQSFKLS